MRLKNLFIVLFLTLIATANAKPVSIEDAKKIALFDFELSHEKKVSIKNYDEIKHKGQTVIYLIRFNGGGCRSIAADDRFYPFVGGSKVGDAPLDGYYEHFSAIIEDVYNVINGKKKDIHSRKADVLKNIWHDMLNQDVRKLEKDIKLFYQEDDGKKKEKNIDESNNSLLLNLPTKGYIKLRDPITTRWHQKEDYNYYCPVVASKDKTLHSLAGCTAIAMAQICKHYNWPKEISGLMPYETTDGTLAGTIPANLKFDYSKMPTTNYSVSYDGDDLARLIVSIGIAMQMRYGSTSTTGSSPLAGWSYVNTFREYLDYFDEQQTTYETSKAKFINIIQTEIILNRPLLLAFKPGSSGAHMAIIDGFSFMEQKANIITGWWDFPEYEFTYDQIYDIEIESGYKSKLVYNLKDPCKPATYAFTESYNASSLRFVFPKPSWFTGQLAIRHYNIWKKKQRPYIWHKGSDDSKEELVKINTTPITHFDNMSFYQQTVYTTMEEKETYAFYVSTVYDSTGANGYTPSFGANEVFSDPIYRMANDDENSDNIKIGDFTFVTKSGDLLDDAWETSYWGSEYAQNAEGNPDNDMITTSSKEQVPYKNYYEQYYKTNPTVVDNPVIPVDDVVRPLKMLKPLVVDRMLWKVFSGDYGDFLFAGRLSSGIMDYELNPEYKIDGVPITNYQLKKVEAALGFTYHPYSGINARCGEHYYAFATQKFFLPLSEYYSYDTILSMHNWHNNGIFTQENKTALFDVMRKQCDYSSIDDFVNLDYFQDSYNNGVLRGFSRNKYLIFNGWHTQQDWHSMHFSDYYVNPYYEPVFTTNYVENKYLEFTTEDFPAPSNQQLYDDNKVYLATPYVPMNYYSNDDYYVTEEDAQSIHIGAYLLYNPIFKVKVRCTLFNPTNSTTKVVEEFYPYTLNKLTNGSEAWGNHFGPPLPPWTWSGVQGPGFGSPEIVVNQNSGNVTFSTSIVDIKVDNIDTSVDPPYPMLFRMIKNEIVSMERRFAPDKCCFLTIKDNEGNLFSSGRTAKELHINIGQNFTPSIRSFDFVLKYLKDLKHFTVTQPPAPPEFLNNFIPRISAVLTDYNDPVIHPDQSFNGYLYDGNEQHRSVLCNYDPNQQYILNHVINNELGFKSTAVCAFDANGDGTDERAVLYIKYPYKNTVISTEPIIPGLAKIVIYNQQGTTLKEISLNYDDDYRDLGVVDINDDGRLELLAVTNKGILKAFATADYTLLKQFDLRSNFHYSSNMSLVKLATDKICMASDKEKIICQFMSDNLTVKQSINDPGDYQAVMIDCSAGDIDNDGQRELVCLYKGLKGDMYKASDYLSIWKYNSATNYYENLNGTKYSIGGTDLNDSDGYGFSGRVTCGDFLPEKPGDEIAITLNRFIQKVDPVNLYNPTISIGNINVPNYGECFTELNQISGETYLEADKETFADIDYGNFTVAENLILSGQINNNGIYKAKNKLTTSGSTIVNAEDVIFEAGTEQEFNPGFETTETVKIFETVTGSSQKSVRQNAKNEIKPNNGAVKNENK